MNHTPKHYCWAYWQEYGVSWMFSIRSLVGTWVTSFYIIYSLNTDMWSTKCLMKFKYYIHTIKQLYDNKNEVLLKYILMLFSHLYLPSFFHRFVLRAIQVMKWTQKCSLHKKQFCKTWLKWSTHLSNSAVYDFDSMLDTAQTTAM